MLASRPWRPDGGGGRKARLDISPGTFLRVRYRGYAFTRCISCRDPVAADWRVATSAVAAREPLRRQSFCTGLGMICLPKGLQHLTLRLGIRLLSCEGQVRPQEVVGPPPRSLDNASVPSRGAMASPTSSTSRSRRVSTLMIDTTRRNLKQEFPLARFTAITATPASLGGACGSFGNISGRKLSLGTVKNCANLFVPVPPSTCATGNGELEGRPYQFVCLAK